VSGRGAAAVASDEPQAGQQADELAQAIMQGSATIGTIHYPRTAVRRLNDSVTSKLGITVRK
jgi:hypothetical protein